LAREAGVYSYIGGRGQNQQFVVERYGNAVSSGGIVLRVSSVWKSRVANSSISNALWVFSGIDGGKIPHLQHNHEKNASKCGSTAVHALKLQSFLHSAIVKLIYFA